MSKNPQQFSNTIPELKDRLMQCFSRKKALNTALTGSIFESLCFKHSTTYDTKKKKDITIWLCDLIVREELPEIKVNENLAKFSKEVRGSLTGNALILHCENLLIFTPWQIRSTEDREGGEKLCHLIICGCTPSQTKPSVFPFDHFYSGFLKGEPLKLM